MVKIAMTCAAAAVLALSLAQPGFAANSLSIRNAGNTPVRIGFDGGTAQTIAPRATATIALDSGDHTAQCRFDGGFDRCNIEERFTLGDDARISFSLLPVYTLRHAVTLAQQGALSIETRRDPVWATTPEDLAGRVPTAQITKQVNSPRSQNGCAAACMSISRHLRPRRCVAKHAAWSPQ